jgi:hypothetical protein
MLEEHAAATERHAEALGAATPDTAIDVEWLAFVQRFPPPVDS